MTISSKLLWCLSFLGCTPKIPRCIWPSHGICSTSRQAQFAGRGQEVAFVSLSIDANAADWRRAVAADHLAEAPNQVRVLGQLPAPAPRQL